MGEGWVSEEALAIALYCALVAPDLASGIRTAVNITGDSDSTGSITGQILGAMQGEEAIPGEWLRRLELREVIADVAEDFVRLHEEPRAWEREDYWGLLGNPWIERIPLNGFILPEPTYSKMSGVCIRFITAPKLMINLV